MRPNKYRSFKERIKNVLAIPLSAMAALWSNSGSTRGHKQPSALSLRSEWENGSVYHALSPIRIIYNSND